MVLRASLLALTSALSMGAGEARAQWWLGREPIAAACDTGCDAPDAAAGLAPEPAPASLAVFTPRMSLTGGEALSGGVAVLLGEPFGVATSLTLSTASFDLGRGDSGFGLGAGLTMLGWSLGGQYLRVDQSDPQAAGEMRFGGSYAHGGLILGAGVTLPLSESDPAASTSLDVLYRAAPGLTLGGSIALSETDAPQAAPQGALSAGVSLRLDF